MLLLNAPFGNLEEKLEEYFGKSGDSAQVRETVSRILADIARRGDAAVSEYTKQFDKAVVPASALRVSPEELAKAAEGLSDVQRASIYESIANVREFHAKTIPQSWSAKNPHGATVGEKYYPIRRVGCYVPGGQVPLVSTVVMSCAIGKLAGVQEMAATTPPGADGSVAPELLATFHLCGVDEVYKVGGVQAIGAMAFGTDTIPAVDKIFGPGNAYVMEAKRQVFGTVGVDLLPGPSEVMIIADETADPRFIAADLLAQAEHGSGKERIYLAIRSEAQLPAIDSKIQAQAAKLSHGAAIAKILEKNFVVLVCPEWEDAVEVANLIAPEHMELHVEDSQIEPLTEQITTAGAILQGPLSPTVLGDFTAGPSHTLPTGFSGRAFSGLRLTDFLRRSSIVRYDTDSLQKARATVRQFSSMEQLDAHGNSLEIRFS
jgi:histidinol dehydrogenase